MNAPRDLPDPTFDTARATRAERGGWEYAAELQRENEALRRALQESRTELTSLEITRTQFHAVMRALGLVSETHPDAPHPAQGCVVCESRARIDDMLAAFRLAFPPVVGA